MGTFWSKIKMMRICLLEAIARKVLLKKVEIIVRKKLKNKGKQ